MNMKERTKFQKNEEKFNTFFLLHAFVLNI
jgi:hypothetical protein